MTGFSEKKLLKLLKFDKRLNSDGLIKELKVSMTSLKTNYMDEVSGMVDYVKMLKSSEFAVYRR